MENHNLRVKHILPVELEWEIFEIAASQRSIGKFDELVNLMMVARRVYEWLKLILYNVMMNSRSSWEHNYPPTHDQGLKPIYPRYGKYVLHLMLESMHIPEALDILKFCPDAQNIALWHINGRNGYHGFHSVFKNMQIQKLSIDIEKLFRISPDSKSFRIDPSIFIHLTHLDITCFQAVSWTEWEPLTQIPTLTHLAISRYNKGFVINMLSTSHRLELLIVILDIEGLHATGEEILKVEAERTDERLVLLRNADDDFIAWEGGAHGEQDLWIIAEMKKEKRIPLWRQLQLVADDL